MAVRNGDAVYRGVVDFSLDSEYYVITALDKDLREVRETFLGEFIDDVHDYKQKGYLDHKSGKDTFASQMIHLSHTRINDKLSDGREISGILIKMCEENLNDKKTRKSGLQRILNSASKYIRV